MKNALIGICLAVLLIGSRSASAFAIPLWASTNGDMVARIHWLGKKGISSDTNAATLITVWNLPETAKFENELVEKFAAAPWQLVRGETNRNSSKLIGPLIRDLLEEESYIEVRGPAISENGPGELVLAVRLPKEKAETWKTNLAAALESITAIRPVSTKNGWSLKKHHVPNLIQLDRAGDWTVLGAAHETNGLFEEILARIRRDKVPFAAPTEKVWLDADIDLPRAAAVLGHALKLPENFPKISFTMKGEGQNVRSDGQLDFPEPVSITLNPLNFPTNLISDNLSSLTVIRGWVPEFASQLWNEAHAGPVPEQIYIWSYDAAPMETYLAAPLVDASNAVSDLGDYVLKKYEPWFATHELARLQRAKAFNGLEWRGVPFVSPFVKSTNGPTGNFLLAGFLPPPLSEGAPETLLRGIQSNTNLVYFDWELTGSRIGQLVYLTQLIRTVSDRAELPPQSAGLQWLLAMSKRNGVSNTQIVHSGPTEFAFARSSSIPFTALELHWLVAWFESRDFPAIRAFPSSESYTGKQESSIKPSRVN